MSNRDKDKMNRFSLKAQEKLDMLPSFLQLKNRRGGYVVGYNMSLEAKEYFDSNLKLINESRKLSDGSSDKSYMHITSDGSYVDPDLDHVVLPYSSAVDFNNDWDEDDFFKYERFGRNK